MGKRIKSIGWFLMFLVSMGLLLYGCGGKKQATTGKQVEIRFGYPGAVGDYQAIKDQVIPMFEEAHPNIKVNLEYQPWGQFWTKLKTQIAAGEAPDFWVSDGVYFMEYADRGALKDLTDWVKRDFEEKDFLGLDFASDPDGRIWGIPREIQTIAFYYNKEAFNEIGLSYPDETWDWDTLLSSAKKLTKDPGSDKRISQYGFYSTNWVSGGWFNFIYQNKGRILDETRTKSMLNQPEAIEAVKYMVDMIHKHKVSPTGEVAGSFGGLDAVFPAKVVAMYFNNYGMSAVFNQTKDLDYDAAILPKGKVRAVSYNANPYVINAKATPERAQAAWEFIEFFASNEAVQKLWSEGGFGIPILKKVVYSKSFIDAPTKPSNKLPFIEPLEKGYGLPMDLNKCWQEWRTALSQNIGLAWMGQVSVETAMLNAHKEVQEILDRAFSK